MHWIPVLALVASTLNASPPVSLSTVRAIHLSGQAELIGPDRQVAECLTQKLAALGPFTFPNAPDQADAVLTFTTHLPGGASRIIGGRSPSIKAELKGTDGTVLWSGENKYKKSTTAWGASSDIPCGLANGLANKLVKAIQQARP